MYIVSDVFRPPAVTGQTHMKAQRLAYPSVITASSHVSTTDTDHTPPPVQVKPPTGADLAEREKQKKLELAK